MRYTSGSRNGRPAPLVGVVLAAFTIGCAPADASPAGEAEAGAAASHAAAAVVAAPQTWTDRVPLPEERTEVVAATDGTRIFLAGGFAPPEREGERASAPRALWVYDTRTDRWASPVDIPEGVHHAGLAYVDGRLYLVGGFRETSFEPVAHVWIYDVESNEWSAGEPMPTPRGAGALAVLEGRIHWIGGNAAEGEELSEAAHGEVADDLSVGTHEVYDPATDRWTRLAPLPTARNHHGAAAFDGRIHVVAGRADGGFEMTVHEVYDPGEDSWAQAPPVPTGRSGIAVVTLGDWFYVFGGETFTDEARTFDETERFRPDTEEWEVLPAMPTARHGLGAAAVEGRIHVISGGPGPGFTFGRAHEVLEVGIADHEAMGSGS